MPITHNLGFPRIGAKRELKFALERYWKKEFDEKGLNEVGQLIRMDNWGRQIKANQDFISVGDFSWYDHVLDMSALLGVIPERFKNGTDKVDLNTYFRMARGRATKGTDARACEMTKWFDTNYHYIVPEFSANQQFELGYKKLLNEIHEAQQLGKPVKPILIGPLTYLYLGKCQKEGFNKLDLLTNLNLIYLEIFKSISQLGVEWIQIDEPILTLNLTDAWQQAFKQTYELFRNADVKLLLTTYFGGLENNMEFISELPTHGLHIDIIRAEEQTKTILSNLPDEKILSVGVVDGRNVWRTDFKKALQILKPFYEKLENRLWIGSSCSLLHCPVDLQNETQLEPEIKNWLAFATQKLSEINFLSRALLNHEASILKELDENQKIMDSRKNSSRIHNNEVKKRCDSITKNMMTRLHSYNERKYAQKELLNLPYFPTTTIGSFPQTADIRKIRHDYKAGNLSYAAYQNRIFKHIEITIHKQENLGLDVLVHGECERNDMVEYFGELLDGIIITQNGWVQSYGSRCVKPPIIFGDIKRTKPMTVEWISYAQSLTEKPVKGMLTGPMTILGWSFVRDDQPRFKTAKQIALALRDEVDDLVKEGIHIIQIDEPAFREGLPLRKSEWKDYLEEAVNMFRLASSGVPDHIQIHTHMCYSEFNDIIESIADLDADVITIETSRSNMGLLKAFERFNYPNEIGPGVYDIHSPIIPTTVEMVELLEKAIKYIPIQQIWVNPDCGLKTREWNEVESALKNMVASAKLLRKKFKLAQKQSDQIPS